MDRRIRAWSFRQAALRVETDARSAVFVRHQIVHNPRVVSDLARSGATFVEELDAVPTMRPSCSQRMGSLRWSGNRPRREGYLMSMPLVCGNRGVGATARSQRPQWALHWRNLNCSAMTWRASPCTSRRASSRPPSPVTTGARVRTALVRESAIYYQFRNSAGFQPLDLVGSRNEGRAAIARTFCHR